MTTSPAAAPAAAAPPPSTAAPPPRSKRPTCLLCPAPAKIKRPKNSHPLCIAHFLSTFESEILNTLLHPPLFQPGETIAIGASGGKDSTVLASVLTTLNKRHNLNLNLHLLSIDEGIVGYRDHSLATVKRNATQYSLPLTILSYADLYAGWTMDRVVATIGKKNNCTYCGVFRRQALDRGCELLGITHVVTGHNADDMAETVLMNLLRGDLPRLGRCTAITTQSEGGRVRRSKPMKYAYQKEIVLYAHYMKLDYFTTECTYAPEAFRGSARDLVKGLERIRPSAILDIVRSGEAYAGLLNGVRGGQGGQGGSGKRRGCIEQKKKDEKETETEIGTAKKSPCDPTSCACTSSTSTPKPPSSLTNPPPLPLPLPLPLADESPLGTCSSSGGGGSGGGSEMHTFEAQLRASEASPPSPPLPLPLPKDTAKGNNEKKGNQARKKQVLRSCARCGYLSSQETCQACVMLDALNRLRGGAGVLVEMEVEGGGE